MILFIDAPSGLRGLFGSSEFLCLLPDPGLAESWGNETASLSRRRGFVRTKEPTNFPCSASVSASVRAQPSVSVRAGQIHQDVSSGRTAYRVRTEELGGRERDGGAFQTCCERIKNQTKIARSTGCDGKSKAGRQNTGRHHLHHRVETSEVYLPSASSSRYGFRLFPSALRSVRRAAANSPEERRQSSGLLVKIRNIRRPRRGSETEERKLRVCRSCSDKTAPG